LLGGELGGKKMLEIYRWEGNINITLKERVGKVYLGFLGSG
jgi:hypothetical protein